MSNRAIRMYTPDQPYDEWNKPAKLMNFGVRASEARWSKVAGNENRKSIYYKLNTYVPDCQLELDLNFPTVFTVCFWAKFPAAKNGDSDISMPRFLVILDDGTVLRETISTPDNEWHYYAVCRDNSNVIRMFIDGIALSTEVTSTVPLNLANNSYVYVGQDRQTFTGDEVIVDDLCIVEGALYTGNFSLPTNYIDLSGYKSYLVIEISTGKVWGYKEVVTGGDNFHIEI